MLKDCEKIKSHILEIIADFYNLRKLPCIVRALVCKKNNYMTFGKVFASVIKL